MRDHTPTTIDLSQFSWELGETKVLELKLYLPPLHLAGQDYRFIPPEVPARIEATYAGRGYNLKLTFSCRLEGSCWRCLEPADLDLEVSVEDFFELELPPLEELTDEDEALLWYMEDGSINVSNWARDAVVELLPPKILCDTACRGLCAQCGTNLNVEECSCEAPPDSRWDKLKEWKGGD